MYKLLSAIKELLVNWYKIVRRIEGRGWPSHSQNLSMLDKVSWKVHHDETSLTIRRIVYTLLGYSTFCLLALGEQDYSLVAKNSTINIPLANSRISYLAFVMVGPIILICLTFYLHIFLGHLINLESQFNEKTFRFPVIFNLPYIVSKRLSLFIFYILPIFVILTFAIKGSLYPIAGSSLIILTLLFVAFLVWIGIQRSSNRGLTKMNWTLFCITLFALGFQLANPLEPMMKRGWNLSRADLSGHSLIGFDFANADMRRINFMNADLKSSIFIRANLTGANLKEANLQQANFQEAILERADLTQANLLKANLQNSKLIEANFSQAGLIGASLMEASLEKVNMERANLQWANFERANLTSANLESANFREANFLRARLSNANMQRASLRKTNLTGANLANTKLQESWFNIANLQETNLNKAQLQNVRFRDVTLKNASLREANFQEARLSGVDFQEADLEGVYLSLAILDGVNLKKTNLKKANFSRVTLDGVDFEEAILDGAYFREVVFEDSINISVEQLCKVRSLYNSKLKAPLLDSVQKACPHLLKSPKQNF